MLGGGIGFTATFIWGGGILILTFIAGGGGIDPGMDLVYIQSLVKAKVLTSKT